MPFISLKRKGGAGRLRLFDGCYERMADLESDRVAQAERAVWKKWVYCRLSYPLAYPLSNYLRELSERERGPSGAIRKPDCHFGLSLSNHS